MIITVVIFVVITIIWLSWLISETKLKEIFIKANAINADLHELIHACIHINCDLLLVTKLL